MDGINGIAGITGIVGFGLVGVFGLLTEQSPQWVTLAFVMAFSCGFLPFNILIARVFMGDVGSILLGFVFACMVVEFTRTFSDFVILVSFMFPFYIDELITMVERILDRQRLSLPHRRHFYQVLVCRAQEHRSLEGFSWVWHCSTHFGAAYLVVGPDKSGFGYFGDNSSYNYI